MFYVSYTYRYSIDKLQLYAWNKLTEFSKAVSLVR